MQGGHSVRGSRQAVVQISNDAIRDRTYNKKTSDITFFDEKLLYSRLKTKMLISSKNTF